MSRDDYFFDPALIEQFHIFNVGEENCLPGYQFGPHMRDHYVIHYVLSGSGIFEKDSIRYAVKAGQFFLIAPDEVTFYRADDEEPWHYFWLGLTGSETKGILSQLGILDYQRVGTVEQPKILAQWIRELLKASSQERTNSLYIQGMAQAILGEFQLKQVVSYQKTAKTNSHIEKLLYAIQSNFGRTDYTVQELAKTLHLTSPYLTALTKKELGKSPSQILNEYRLEKAKYLISKTDMLIREVALAVGYESPLSFSRAYKNYFGVPPSQQLS